MQPKAPGLSVIAQEMNSRRCEFEFDVDNRAASARRMYRNERREGRTPRDARLIVAGLLFCSWRVTPRDGRR